MKFLILTLFFVCNSWSADRLELDFKMTEVHQGALVSGVLLIQPESVNLPVQKLKGATIAETIYFQQLSAPLKKDGTSAYASDVKVIFIKPPESETITGSIGPNEIQINVGGIKVVPIQSTGQMIWADFTAPDFFAGNLKWLWITLLLILLATSSFVVWKKVNKKRKIAAHRKKLLKEFRGCTTYEEIVSLWKRKRVYLQEFPLIDDNFKNFEDVLFRYQFKPQQTEAEKEIVLIAYRKLLEASEGVLRGI
jgi:hypothetical protein